MHKLLKNLLKVSLLVSTIVVISKYMVLDSIVILAKTYSVSQDNFQIESSKDKTDSNTNKFKENLNSEINDFGDVLLKLQAEGMAVDPIETKADYPIIAIIDTGIDYTHPDLEDKIQINYNELKGDIFKGLDKNNDQAISLDELKKWKTSPLQDFNDDGEINLTDLLTPDDSNIFLNNKDDDKNGFKDDLIGWDFKDNDNDPFDENGHGTHVSGIIVAENKAFGKSAMCSNCKLLPVKAFGATGEGTSRMARESFDYANKFDIDVINNSWGFYGEKGTNFSKSINKALENNTFIVAVAGNQNQSIDENKVYPASIPEVITVGSILENGNKASDSNFGEVVDYKTVGVHVLSTFPKGAFVSPACNDANFGAPDDGYGYCSGTSMAGPKISGTIGMYLEEGKSREEIIENLDSLYAN